MAYGDDRRSTPEGSHIAAGFRFTMTANIGNQPPGPTEDLDGNPFTTAPPPDDKKPRVRVEGCIACGGLHGGTTAELNCLRQSVGYLRYANGALRALVERLVRRLAGER